MNSVHFLNETEDMQLTCSLCHDRLAKPVQTINGHRFCENCFLEKRSRDKSCKRCVEDDIEPEKDCNKLEPKDCFGDRSVVYDMYNMPSICKVCGYSGTYREIKKFHEKHGCQKPCCICQKSCGTCVLL